MVPSFALIISAHPRPPTSGPHTSLDDCPFGVPPRVISRSPYIPRLPRHLLVHLSRRYLPIFASTSSPPRSSCTPLSISPQKLDRPSLRTSPCMQTSLSCSIQPPFVVRPFLDRPAAPPRSPRVIQASLSFLLSLTLGFSPCSSSFSSIHSLQHAQSERKAEKVGVQRDTDPWPRKGDRRERWASQSGSATFPDGTSRHPLPPSSPKHQNKVSNTPR